MYRALILEDDPAAADALRIVRLADIAYVEILKHDLYWHIEGEAEPIRQRGSLKAAEEELGTQSFCRIAASHIVNMAHVVRLRSGSVTMSDGSELAISRSRKAEATKALARFAGVGA